MCSPRLIHFCFLAISCLLHSTYLPAQEKPTSTDPAAQLQIKLLDLQNHISNLSDIDYYDSWVAYDEKTKTDKHVKELTKVEKEAFFLLQAELLDSQIQIWYQYGQNQITLLQKPTKSIVSKEEQEITLGKCVQLQDLSLQLYQLRTPLAITQESMITRYIRRHKDDKIGHEMKQYLTYIKEYHDSQYLIIRKPTEQK